MAAGKCKCCLWKIFRKHTATNICKYEALWALLVSPKRETDRKRETRLSRSPKSGAEERKVHNTHPKNIIIIPVAIIAGERAEHDMCDVTAVGRSGRINKRAVSGLVTAPVTTSPSERFVGSGPHKQTALHAHNTYCYTATNTRTRDVCDGQYRVPSVFNAKCLLIIGTLLISRRPGALGEKCAVIKTIRCARASVFLCMLPPANVGA